MAKAAADSSSLPFADVLKRGRYTRPQTSAVAANHNEKHMQLLFNKACGPDRLGYMAHGRRKD